MEEQANMKAEQPEKEMTLALGFNVEQEEAESAVAQAKKMPEQQAIPESIQDEDYVKANRRFIRQERTAIVTLFMEFDMEMNVESDAEEPEESQEHELQLSSNYSESGMKMVDILYDD
ncbi:hypothetical protein D1007_21789 [Hordeum vulgare]|nr:hypothetical protein D1007_21789 [Hordeum vulgare]